MWPGLGTGGQETPGYEGVVFVCIRCSLSSGGEQSDSFLLEGNSQSKTLTIQVNHTVTFRTITTLSTHPYLQLQNPLSSETLPVISQPLLPLPQRPAATDLLLPVDLPTWDPTLCIPLDLASVTEHHVSIHTTACQCSTLFPG